MSKEDMKFERTTSTQTPSKKKLKRVVSRTSPIEGAIKKMTNALSIEASEFALVDKLVLVAPVAELSESMLEVVGERLSACKHVRKHTSKGDSYKQKFVLLCPSGTKVILSLLPADARMLQGLKIQLNPAQMNLEDARRFYETLKTAFLPDWKSVMEKLSVQRVDQAYDHPVLINDLIIQARGLTVEEKYFVATDRNGRIQTWYCGSLESRLHYAAYNQNDSDDFKIAHDEKPSRPSAYANAEVVIRKSREQKHMTRFEARRVFKTPQTLEQLDEGAAPFGRFVIYQVDEAAIEDAPEYFKLYLDSIRLRGVAGARKHFAEGMSKQEAKKKLAAFDAYMKDCLPSWWDKSNLNCSVKQALEQTPVWKVLKRLK